MDNIERIISSKTTTKACYREIRIPIDLDLDIDRQYYLNHENFGFLHRNVVSQTFICIVGTLADVHPREFVASRSAKSESLSHI